jgi:hypothetical protein
MATTSNESKTHHLVFTKVKVARELLRQQADEILKLYMDNAKLAMARGDYETAQKALQWLIEHMPAEVDGTRLVDSGIDKQPSGQQGNTGPTIQIGIQVGGVPAKPLDAPKKPVAAIEAEILNDE